MKQYFYIIGYHFGDDDLKIEKVFLQEDRETALRNHGNCLPEHYNEQHPRSALNYRSPRDSGAWQLHQFNGELVSGFVGANPPLTSAARITE